jgi:hypothetical protein
MSGAPERPPRPATPPGDPRRQEPRVDDPRLQDLYAPNPYAQDPRHQAPRRQEPQMQVPPRPDPAPRSGADPRVHAQPAPQPQPRMQPQQAAPQSAPRAAPDPQARWHDPHGGTHHPAYDPGYSALDQAVDVPHRPSPGPGYLPVDPVSRGYQEPRGPQPAHGWAQDGWTQGGSMQGGSMQSAAPPTAPMPQAPPRMPRNMYPQADHDDDSRLPPWLRRTAAVITAGASAAAVAARGGIATLRARRAEKARLRAREEAARAADALDADPSVAGRYVQEPERPGMRAPRQPGQKLSAKEKRWQRRRRRHVVEEIIGWILVPIILIALYFALIGGLALFGLSLDDLMDGLRMVRAQFS